MVQQDAPLLKEIAYKQTHFCTRQAWASFDFNCQSRNQWIMDHVLKLRKCTKAKWHLKTILANSKKHFENCVQVRTYVFAKRWPRVLEWIEFHENLKGLKNKNKNRMFRELLFIKGFLKPPHEQL